MEKAEEIIIRETLAAQKGNKSITAKILNIGRKTIHRKLSYYEKTGDDAHKTVIEEPQGSD
jgi:DNA-binding NtrC family response regulator